jgi:hypothetical protein
MVTFALAPKPVWDSSSPKLVTRGQTAGRTTNPHPRRFPAETDNSERQADLVADQLSRSRPAVAALTDRDSVSRTGGINRPARPWQSNQNGGDPAVHSTEVENVLESPGQPLDSSTRVFFESRFSHDFGRVRVHADQTAARSARGLNARAYTVGNAIVFGAGEYRPRDTEGKRLLAHELTHVCQQSTQPAPALQRQQTPPVAQAQAPPSDAVVQKHIDTALATHATVEDAWRDMRDSRCLPQNCGDVNMAAAEHYLFARYVVQESGILPPDLMLPTVLAAVAAYSLWKLGFELLGRHAPPLFCPQACLVTPTSGFQVRWGSKGATDGNLMTFNKGRI